ncbi:tRNA (adenosine(37)-N6)-dimethylallyltransferase MiaA [Kineococcus glutinatus]|uniref:tRNA dimethylallyltransferase n=1 Tax=Kineococcus glutinatus TaxID=1070872 RepID=A0ABP9I836_9ACTN
MPDEVVAAGLGTVVALVGPTAAGKSDVAVALAARLAAAGRPAEVVNADAMQLYRGMDVGTAKLTGHERRGVPHHLLDVLDVREPADVATYQHLARTAVADVAARGAVPLLVGGSGLYVRAVLDEMDFPGTDPVLRRRWEERLAAVGAGALHAELAAVDPAAAARILPSNGRRIVRALEVVELTGRPFSASLPQPRYVRPAVQVSLAVPRPQLDARIDARVRRMLDAGLVAEVEALAARGLREGRTASRALGYAQVLDALDGRCTLAEAAAETARATRKFARRQESWFRRDPRVRWVPAPDGRGAAELADEVWRVLAAGAGAGAGAVPGTGRTLGP